MTFEFDRLVELAWDQLWQVSAVAVVVAALVHVFGHRRPHLAYLLWLLVLVKCLTPPVWSSPTGVFSWARLETRKVETSVTETLPPRVTRVTADFTIETDIAPDCIGHVICAFLQLRLTACEGRLKGQRQGQRGTQAYS